MEETVQSGRVGTPWHLWAVGVVSLLWNAFGCFDYIMTNIRDPAYLAAFPPEMMQMIDEFPIWTMAAWACGVWGALAGSLLLLLRSRFAVHAFALSLLGLAASTVYQFGTALPASLRTPGLYAMNAVIWIGAIAFLVYAMRMRAKGVLR
ncbi:hypothetical protein [Novosphingobium album (ex Liu et al. 2023)]|uniref:Sugar transporter n=1 Tax=Novosphingobium album (ex Liu et al. 2023) TaxID=3031130 RepID=A0ABT5WLF8_9SPHN|nr:hypothetical protein [Novosphingobium album (ex Liu et al. 2023)]MDE8650867.1 hypothetical protein [Novosphingobium album (ex Liu et al. 2023)]